MLDTSLYGNAILQAMVEARNPMNRMLIKAMDEDAEHSALQLDQQRQEFLKQLRADLKQAKENNEDAAVIDGLKRLIEKHTNKQR